MSLVMPCSGKQDIYEGERDRGVPHGEGRARRAHISATQISHKYLTNISTLPNTFLSFRWAAWRALCSHISCTNIFLEMPCKYLVWQISSHNIFVKEAVCLQKLKVWGVCGMASPTPQNGFQRSSNFPLLWIATLKKSLGTLPRRVYSTQQL